jgi:hypothetical protein
MEGKYALEDDDMCAGAWIDICVGAPAGTGGDIQRNLVLHLAEDRVDRRLDRALLDTCGAFCETMY